jgi:hypothetical protein
MLVRILCFDDGHRRALDDLKLTVSEKFIFDRDYCGNLGNLFIEYIEYEK